MRGKSVKKLSQSGCINIFFNMHMGKEILTT